MIKVVLDKSCSHFSFFCVVCARVTRKVEVAPSRTVFITLAALDVTCEANTATACGPHLSRQSIHSTKQQQQELLECSFIEACCGSYLRLLPEQLCVEGVSRKSCGVGLDQTQKSGGLAEWVWPNRQTFVFGPVPPGFSRRVHRRATSPKSAGLTRKCDNAPEASSRQNETAVNLL